MYLNIYKKKTGHNYSVFYIINNKLLNEKTSFRSFFVLSASAYYYYYTYNLYIWIKESCSRPVEITMTYNKLS